MGGGSAARPAGPEKATCSQAGGPGRGASPTPLPAARPASWGTTPVPASHFLGSVGGGRATRRTGLEPVAPGPVYLRTGVCAASVQIKGTYQARAAFPWPPSSPTPRSPCPRYAPVASLPGGTLPLAFLRDISQGLPSPCGSVGLAPNPWPPGTLVCSWAPADFRERATGKPSARSGSEGHRVWSLDDVLVHPEKEGEVGRI